MAKVKKKSQQRLMQEGFVKKATSGWDQPKYQITYMRGQLHQGVISYAELRKEYSKLRGVAEQRVRKLKAAGYEHTKLIEELPVFGHFAKTRDLTDAQLPMAIQQVATFMASNLSTVTGQKLFRRDVISGLKGKYPFVTEENLDAWVMFIEAARARGSASLLYASGKTEESFTKWVNRGKLNRRSLSATFREFEKKYYSDQGGT